MSSDFPAIALGGPERDSRSRREADPVLLRRALARIDRRHRELLVLKDLRGLRYSEIAGILAISDDAVAHRLFRARQALREALEEIIGRAPLTR
jgi:RNA polymerase sigma factor (sigma-70 family)